MSPQDILQMLTERLDGYTSGYVKGYRVNYGVFKTDGSLCVLGIGVANENKNQVDTAVNPIMVFMQENSIQFHCDMAVVANGLQGSAFHMINGLNADYPSIKFVYSENDEKDDEIKAKFYINTEYIKDPEDWRRLLFQFAYDLGLSRVEYAKGWEIFAEK